MVERADQFVFELSGRNEKARKYSLIARAGYPLLHTVCTELGNFRTGDTGETYHPGVTFSDGGKFRLNPDTEDQIRAAFTERGSGYVPSTSKVNNKLQYTGGESSVLGITATNVGDMLYYQRSFISLVNALGYITRGVGPTAQIAAQFKAIYPDTEPRLMLRSGQNATVDGIFSTFLAGEWLSQQPIEGKESIDTPSKFKAVLRSDAVTELTKKIKAGVLVKLPSATIIPERQLKVDPVSGELVLHEDTNLFVDIFNERERTALAWEQSDSKPVELQCPFTVPLRNGRLHIAMTAYGDTLPDPVVQSMVDMSDETGMNIAGNAIADFLDKAA